MDMFFNCCPKVNFWMPTKNWNSGILFSNLDGIYRICFQGQEKTYEEIKN